MSQNSVHEGGNITMEEDVSKDQCNSKEWNRSKPKDRESKVTETEDEESKVTEAYRMRNPKLQKPMERNLAAGI